MKLFEVSQLKRPFVISWTPSNDPRSNNLEPQELYDFGLTSMPRGTYSRDEEVIVVANTTTEALSELKVFLEKSGYLNDTYDNDHPTWAKSKHPHLNQIAQELESNNFEKV